MKSILTASLLLCFSALSAQQNPIKLRNGQKISATINNQIEADLGNGMLMKNNSEARNIIVVAGEKDDNYLLTNTLEMMKIKMEFMGQTQEFNSEKDEDKETELGKQMSPLVGQPFNITLSKITGKAIPETKEESQAEENPLQSMLGSNGHEEVIKLAFFQMPKGRKNGETWKYSDSSAAGVNKFVYTLHNVEGDKAIISFTSEMDIAKAMESQGQEMFLTMKVKSKGDFTSDVQTGLVSTRNMETEISGNIDVMGQSMPIMATNTQRITYQNE